MNRKILSLVVLVAALCATILPAASPAVATVGDTAGRAATAQQDPDARARRVVFFDLYYQAKVKPRRIFFSANSGTFVKKLVWQDWGTRQTTATGVYVSTCASCDPPRYREATVRFSGLRFCAERGVWYYRRGVLIREPSEGQTRRAEISPGTCGTRD